MNGWNDRCHPLVWIKTADQVLKQAKRSTPSEAGHLGGGVRHRVDARVVNETWR